MKRKAKSQAESRDSENENFYVKAFHLMLGYSYLLDKDCILVDCNTSFLKLLGLNSLPEKTPGFLYKKMLERKLWSENQTLLIKSADINAIVSNESNTLELPGVDEKSNITYYQFSRMPLVDDSGVVSGLLVIINDISPLKQMTEQLEKIKSQLQTQNAKAGVNLTNNFEIRTKSDPVKVLVIEDNPVAQKAAQALLMNNDCLVKLAGTEAEFSKIFVPGEFDLVFMDIGLEGTSGYIMAKQLRLKEKDSGFHVPIIALTGYDANVVQFDCDYYQMEGVITKPLTAEQVKQIIQRYIFKINMDVTGLMNARSQ